MRTTIETITPAKALAYLAKNTRNRPIRDGWVSHLVQQIQSGNWQTTHQGVAIAVNGDLLDGQHRLTAIVQAGKSVQMNVTTGVPLAAYKVTDCGLKRSTSDRIHLLNDRAHNALACQVINNYCRYALGVHGVVPVSMVEDEFLRYSDSWVWLVAQFQQKLAIYGRVGVLSAIGIYHVIDKEKATEFAHGYRTGENLAQGSPILTLRRSIESVKGASSGAGSDYWRAVAATRAHHQDRTLRMIFGATEDMVGNSNTSRVVAERSEKGRKAAQTRYGKKVVA